MAHHVWEKLHQSPLRTILQQAHVLAFLTELLEICIVWQSSSRNHRDSISHLHVGSTAHEHLTIVGARKTLYQLSIVDDSETQEEFLHRLRHLLVRGNAHRIGLIETIEGIIIGEEHRVAARKLHHVLHTLVFYQANEIVAVTTTLQVVVDIGTQPGRVLAFLVVKLVGARSHPTQET